jgi:hypothetical protein
MQYPRNLLALIVVISYHEMVLLRVQFKSSLYGEYLLFHLECIRTFHKKKEKLQSVPSRCLSVHQIDAPFPR